MTDIKLDTTTHDLVITNNDIQLFEKIENLTVQKVKINLLNNRGEWFRNINVGVPYTQTILGKKGTKTVADSLLKNTIINTDGIQSITNYSSTINSDRTLKVIFSAVTDTGQIINDITVEI